MRRWVDVGATLLIFVAMALVIARLDRLAMQEVAGQARIADGDSLELQGERLRLKGIDAPELGQNCGKPEGTYDCGRRAREALTRLAAKPDLSCEGWERDRYGRLLVRCTAGGREVNAAMVEDGWAVAYGDYEREEGIARSNKRGIWAGTFDEPQDWRRQQSARQEPRHGMMTSGINILRNLIGAGGGDQ